MGGLGPTLATVLQGRDRTRAFPCIISALSYPSRYLHRLFFWRRAKYRSLFGRVESRCYHRVEVVGPGVSVHMYSALHRKWRENSLARSLADLGTYGVHRAEWPRDGVTYRLYVSFDIVHQIKAHQTDANCQRHPPLLHTP